MATEKSSVSPVRIAKLLGFFLGLPIVVLVVVMLYDRFVLGHAPVEHFVAKADEQKLKVPAQPTQLKIQQQIIDKNRLGPCDPFYRFVQAGAEGDESMGQTLAASAKGMVQKSDVLAQSKSLVRQGTWRFSTNFMGWGGEEFGFHFGRYWHEEADWCLRFKIRQSGTGNERLLHDLADRAYLLRLDLPFGATSPERAPDDTFERYAASAEANGLVIPVQIHWDGKSPKEVHQRLWSIAQNSTVCDGQDLK